MRPNQSLELTPPRALSSSASRKLYWLFRTVCSAGLLVCSSALTFCRPSVSARGPLRVESTAKSLIILLLLLSKCQRNQKTMELRSIYGDDCLHVS
jgi:hypothetical protein